MRTSPRGCRRGERLAGVTSCRQPGSRRSAAVDSRRRRVRGSDGAVDVQPIGVSQWKFRGRLHTGFHGQQSDDQFRHPVLLFGSAAGVLFEIESREDRGGVRLQGDQCPVISSLGTVRGERGSGSQSSRESGSSGSWPSSSDREGARPRRRRPSPVPLLRPETVGTASEVFTQRCRRVGDQAFDDRSGGTGNCQSRTASGCRRR
ncbi:MAG: hypothetical protein Ct9H300mP1_25200 [Planctomycetaceae bacterium]|nr:MAG: hypothetical protein Ct9H300mP1_25200 [Planctomycetaceae bacterium]